MLGIVVSRADRASVHVGDHLRDLVDWHVLTDDTRPDGQGGGQVWRTTGAELREFDALHLDLERVDEAFADPSVIAVASRHAGDTGPLLTAHHTGNFGAAEFGGTPGRFARAAPNALKAALQALSARAPNDYETAIECTHHGPTDVDTPSLFVELGSGPDQWADPEAARAVAAAILALRGTAPERERTVVGFGGGHYAPRFERVLRETRWTVGHVAASWALDRDDSDQPDGDPSGADTHRRARAETDDDRPDDATTPPMEVIERAFERSGAEYALIDGDRPQLATRVAEAGFRVVSETWVRETGTVPLALVDRLERAVRPIDDGLRLGALAESCAVDAPLAAVTVPEPLLDAANGVDHERTLAAVRQASVAVNTEEAGSRLANTVIVPTDVGDEDGSENDAGTETVAARDGVVVPDAPPSQYDAVVDALAGSLRRKYDHVERDGDVVVVHEQAFVPERARQLGVEEGPAFGRLTNDQDVEVNGETVTAAQVHERRERRFSVR